MTGLMKRTRAIVAAPPEPFLETERSKARLQTLINAMTADSLILNDGSGFTRLSNRVINCDIFNSGTTDDIASGLQLPFRDESVDLVIMQGVLEHVRDAEAALNECFRV